MTQQNERKPFPWQRLDKPEELGKVIPTPRIPGWRIRTEDFGALAFEPCTGQLVRLDGQEAVSKFIASHDIVQSVDKPPLEHSLRTPVKLFLDLTLICNETCGHCLSSSGQSSESLPVSKVKSILKEAWEMGIFQVKFSGGEPVFHPRWAFLLLSAPMEAL
jgi:hypothetical protein